MTINSGYLFENSHFSVPLVMLVLWRFTAMAVHRTLIGRDERIGTQWGEIGVKLEWSDKLIGRPKRIGMYWEDTECAN